MLHTIKLINFFILSLFTIIILGLNDNKVDGCTAIALPASSTVENAAMTVHVADCSECDPRLALVPGKTWKKGSKHAVYGINSLYPT